MNIIKDENKGTVTYHLPDGATYTLPYKNAEYVVACDGNEVPSKWGGNHYLMMWYKNEKKHDWYCFEEDMSYDTPPWIWSWEEEDSEIFKVTDYDTPVKDRWSL